MTLLYKNSSNWRTQEDAIASDLVNNLKGSGTYTFFTVFSHKKSKKWVKKTGNDDQNVKNKLYGECNTKFDFIIRFVH